MITIPVLWSIASAPGIVVKNTLDFICTPSADEIKEALYWWNTRLVTVPNLFFDGTVTFDETDPKLQVVADANYGYGWFFGDRIKTNEGFDAVAFFRVERTFYYGPATGDYDISPDYDIDFDFSRGNVKDGSVGYAGSVKLTGRDRRFPFHMEVDVLNSTAPSAHFAGDAVLSDPIIRVPFNPDSSAYYNPNRPVRTPPLMYQAYQMNDFIYQLPTGKINFSFVATLGQNLAPGAAPQLRVRWPGYERILDLPLPPLPIIAISQNGQQIADGLWNYATQLSAGSHPPDPYNWKLRSPSLSLLPVNYPEVEMEAAIFDPSQSFSPASPITKWRWDFPVEYGATALSTPLTVTPSEFNPAPVQRLTITAANGIESQFYVAVRGVDNPGSGAVSHPSGALWMPGATANGATAIREFDPKAGINRVVASVPLKNVHLLMHAGESAIWAGGIDSSGRGALYICRDEEIFTMKSAPFPAGYKLLDWHTTWLGGIVAIASQGNKLFQTHTATGDAGSWATPLLVYTATGTANVKGWIRQVTASDESHFIISDGATYAFRNDDAFLETVGTRLF